MNCVNSQEVAEAFAQLLDQALWLALLLVLVGCVCGWLAGVSRNVDAVR